MPALDGELQQPKEKRGIKPHCFNPRVPSYRQRRIEVTLHHNWFSHASAMSNH